VAHYRVRFDELDKNKDGFLTLEEYKSGRAAAPKNQPRAAGGGK
jgi:hypothetical protein